MDVLVPAERGELLDPRLHVVPGDAFAGGDRVQVDLVDDGLVGLDDAVGHVDPEVALRPEHRDPELPLEHDLVLGRPDPREVGAGVPGGQDVGDGHRVPSRERGLDGLGRRVGSLPVGGGPGDVGAVLDAVERDAARAGVRRVAGGAEVRTGGDHGQHPAAGGDQVGAGQGGAGLDDVDALDGLGVLEPADGVAGGGGLGVAAAGEHDGDGGARLPDGRGYVGERPGRRAEQQPRERGVEEREQRLGLGVTEAGVELDDAGAAVGEREAGVQQPGERRAAAGHLVDGRLEDGGEDLVDEAVGGPRERRVGAHAAGVRPLVAVADALEVLRGLERVDRGAVGDREERDLGAVEVLLDDHPLAPGGVVERGLPVLGDDDALAGGEAVVLDDVRRPELVEGGRDLPGRGAGAGGRGRHPGRLHHLLGERLGALEPGGLAGGAEAGDAAAGDRVGDTRDQRRLGADHDQVGAQGGGQVGHRGAVHRVDRVQRGDRRHARVAGGGVHRGDVGVARQRAGQGVLAAPGADHQDSEGGLRWGGHGRQG